MEKKKGSKKKVVGKQFLKMTPQAKKGQPRVGEV